MVLMETCEFVVDEDGRFHVGGNVKMDSASFLLARCCTRVVGEGPLRWVVGGMGVGCAKLILVVFDLGEGAALVLTVCVVDRNLGDLR